MKIEFNSTKELIIFNIKYYRYKNNMTQKDLANKCVLKLSYISSIEKGRHCATIPKLTIIAKSLNLELFQLMQNPKRNKNIVDKFYNK